MIPTTRNHDASLDIVRGRLTLPAFSLALLLLLVGDVTAQTSQESRQQDSLLYVAVTLIDAGELEKARQLLLAGEKMYPANTIFSYEIAYILYKEKKYAECRDRLETIVDSPDNDGTYFQLLGNCHDMLGDPRTAIATYERGLERFPDFGPLYLERGIMWAKIDDIPEAMTMWEKGIQRDPSFSSNYFHAGRLWLAATNPGWGLIYGEIFLNLEPKGPRADMIRELLFDAWQVTMLEKQNDLKISKQDRTIKFNGNVFYKDVSVTHDPVADVVRVPFEYFFIQKMARAVLPYLIEMKPTLTLADLHIIRTQFLDDWYSSEETSSHFAIDLYARHRKLQQEGLFEHYNYWIFGAKANAAEREKWSETNHEKMFELQHWLIDNRIAVDTVRAFSRLELQGMKVSTDDLEDLQK